MTWRKYIQKLIRLLVKFLEKIQKPILATLEALEALRSLELLAALAFGLALLADVLGAAALGTVLASALERNESELILPPGARLRNVLHFIYPPKTAERVFDQIIRDMQGEWQEAIINNQQWLARWVHVRGVLTIFLTAAVHVVDTLGNILKLVK